MNQAFILKARHELTEVIQEWMDKRCDDDDWADALYIQ